MRWMPPAPIVLQQRRRRRHPSVPTAAADPYIILGVPRSATVDDVKKAFRKRALKLHPDVNRAPDARERFMEAKQAYQQLLDERQRRGAGTDFGSSQGRGSAASGDSSGWGYSGGAAGSSGAGAHGQPSQRQRPWVPPEESYSFGDLLRDLEKELSGYAQQRAGSSSTATPKSLWEELYDIGEELVEALEKGLGVSDDEASAYVDLKKKYGDLSGHDSAASGGPGASGSGSTAGPSMPLGSGSSGVTAAAAESRAARKPTTAEIVEEELAALKRKMGKQ